MVMANDSTYTPHPADLSGVPETKLMRAFAELLAEARYESVRVRAPREPFGLLSWDSLNATEKGYYIEDAMNWTKVLEARFGLEGLLGGDIVPPSYIEDTIAREAHERRVALLLDEGWVRGEGWDFVKKESPALVSFDNLPSVRSGNELVDEYRRIGFDINRTIDEFGEIYSKGVGTVDDLLPEGGRSFSSGYMLVVDTMNYLRSELESRVGWKSDRRHYDFGGTDGFYVNIGLNNCTVMHDAEPALRFYAKPDGGVGMDVLSEVFAPYRDLSPLAAISDLRDGNYVLDKANIDLMRQQTHNCSELIYGLRYGETTAFCIPTDESGQDDLTLMRELTARENNIRVVEMNVFSEAVENWLDQSVRPGFESAQTPKLISYIFDGKNLFSERDIDLSMRRVLTPEKSSDWRLIDELLVEGQKVREELQMECGIGSSRGFRFDEAFYPSPLMREDALFICSKHGAEQEGFLTAAKGKICLFESMSGFLDGYDKPKRVFGSVQDAMNYLRSVVLSKQNVMVARGEYAQFVKGKGEGKHM